MDRLAKLGVVTFSGEAIVSLSFPDGYMGDIVSGRILLINDSPKDITISEVETSCGCTSAIPVERIVMQGKRNLLLFSYHPKTPGKKFVEAKLTFGDKVFYLSGVAHTLPRMEPTASTLSFDEHGKVAIELRKLTATPLDRFLISGGNFEVENFSDTREFVTATLIRDPKRTLTEVVVIPAMDTVHHQSFKFQLRYPGVVNLLPRRLISHHSRLRFYLRGDIEPLTNCQMVRLKIDEHEHHLPCTTTQSESVLIVEFVHPLSTGEYEAELTIADFNFSVPITVR